MLLCWFGVVYIIIVCAYQAPSTEAYLATVASKPVLTILVPKLRCTTLPILPAEEAQWLLQPQKTISIR